MSPLWAGEDVQENLLGKAGSFFFQFSSSHSVLPNTTEGKLCLAANPFTASGPVWPLPLLPGS